MKGRERSPAETKLIILDQLRKGQTVENAMIAADRSMKTYEAYRKNDAQFRAHVDRVRREAISQLHEDREGDFPEFAEFSETYLGTHVHPHMQNVIDMIEGRDPSWFHPAMQFERNEPDLMMVNMPPSHGKSMTLTMNYVAYRIAQDPNVRVLVISKTATMARKFLTAIKDRLTDPQYAKFHATFGPPGGYKENSNSWTQNLIYINSDVRTSREKDPTVEALGIRGHIYGARADLIIIDDAVDLENAHEYEKQVEWIQSQVLNRISASGNCIVIGTRLSSKDMYVELKNPNRYLDKQNPWTYLAMPAVLEFAEVPEDWTTLWPYSDQPHPQPKGRLKVQREDGTYIMWDGIEMHRLRARIPVDGWARIYMQQQTTEDQVFDGDAINASINGNRMAGLMPRGMANCRREGMDGLIVVAGMDPAMVGFTSAVVIGLDPKTQKRYVLDLHNRAKMSPDSIRELIKSWTIKYNICEWRIEKNAFQSMLTQDREILQFLSSRGAQLREHHTGGYNKWDATFGVASLATLFAGWQDNNQLVEFPSTVNSEPMKALIEQLVTWHPDVPKTQKTDVLMAWWFVELACRDRCQRLGFGSTTHVKNPFATRYDLSQRGSVNVMDDAAQRFLSSANR